MRHKWGGNLKTKGKDNSSVGCIKCGCVRQYVGGIVTYFIDDTVYDRHAPPCDGKMRPDNDFADRIKYHR